MKKRIIIAVSFLFVLGIAFNVYKTMPEGKNISALLANLEALANDGDVGVGGGIGSNTCPNGGQKTTGRPKNKQWKETHTANSEGKVNANGSTFDFGAEYKNEKVSLYCYSVECENKGTASCVLCNVWCKTRE